MATSKSTSENPTPSASSKQYVENLTDQKLVLTLQNGHALTLAPHQSRVLPTGQEENGTLQKLVDKGLVTLNTPTT